VTATDWLSATVRASAIDRRLRADRILFHSGDSTFGLFEVLEGKVRLVRVDRSGGEAVLQAASAGDTLAEASLFSSAYHCEAAATTKAVIRLNPKALLFAEFARDPKLAQAFAAMLAQQVMALRTRLERHNIHSAHDRVHFSPLTSAPTDARSRCRGISKNLLAGREVDRVPRGLKAGAVLLLPKM
jgi:CRP/FNR family transcriptional regulator, dissimilatory nitrate respiration regulator